MHIELNYPSVAEAFAKVRDMLTISDLGHSVKAVIDIDRNSPYDGSYIHVPDYSAKTNTPIWRKSEPTRKGVNYLLKFVGGGIVETSDYREEEKKFYYEDGEHYYNIALDEDRLYGWLYSDELMNLPKE